jgi:hypothetical protein
MFAKLTPVKIRLGNDGDLLLHDASAVTLVPRTALRVVCQAKLHSPVLGIGMPVTLHSLTLVLFPRSASVPVETSSSSGFESRPRRSPGCRRWWTSASSRR